jgi:hypothetical protein
MYDDRDGKPSHEQVIDAQVQSILARDPAYRNAESAEAQAEREREITEACEREFQAGVQRRLR